MTNALMLQGWDVTGIKVVGNVQEATATYNSLLDARHQAAARGQRPRGNPGRYGALLRQLPFQISPSRTGACGRGRTPAPSFGFHTHTEVSGAQS